MILKLYHRKSSGEMEKVGFLFSYLTVYPFSSMILSRMFALVVAFR